MFVILGLAVSFLVIMVIMFFTSFVFTIPSIIGFIICKKYKKRNGKKVKPVIRIILAVTMTIGVVMFTIPTAFAGKAAYSDYRQAQYKKTLEAAAERGDLARVKQLLDSGVNPDKNRGLNCTALTHACKDVFKENSNYETAKLLIEHKCTVDMAFKGYNDGREKGYTPLMYAVISKQNYDLVKLLIDNKADVNHKAVDGDTPLVRAIQYGNYKVSDLLIEKGADVNYIDNKGKSILEYACNPNFQYASYSMVKDLLEHGSVVNDKGSDLSKLLTEVEENKKDIKSHRADYQTINYGSEVSGFEDNYDKISSILKKYAEK